MRDGYIVGGRVWRPGGNQPERAILYLHGIQSHGGWFEWSAAQLATGRSLVILPDRRGSGVNAQARGDTPAARRWLEDLDEIAAWATREFGVRRFWVVGVSWGGKLAVAWTLKQSERVERVLLIAPGFFPGVDVGVWARIQIGLAMLTRPARLFPIPLNDPALFTEHPAGQRFIADDPLKLTHATARFFYESARLDRQLARVRPRSLQAEITLALAGRDRIIRNTPTQAWLAKVAVRAPAVHTFPAASHTLEFEPDLAPFAALLERWLRADA